jgi:hypothetical protein
MGDMRVPLYPAIIGYVGKSLLGLRAKEGKKRKREKTLEGKMFYG